MRPLPTIPHARSSGRRPGPWSVACPVSRPRGRIGDSRSAGWRISGGTGAHLYGGDGAGPGGGAVSRTCGVRVGRGRIWRGPGLASRAGTVANWRGGALGIAGLADRLPPGPREFRYFPGPIFRLLYAGGGLAPYITRGGAGLVRRYPGRPPRPRPGPGPGQGTDPDPGRTPGASPDGPREDPGPGQGTDRGRTPGRGRGPTPDRGRRRTRGRGSDPARAAPVPGRGTGPQTDPRPVPRSPPDRRRTPGRGSGRGTDRGRDRGPGRGTDRGPGAGTDPGRVQNRRGRPPDGRRRAGGREPGRSYGGGPRGRLQGAQTARQIGRAMMQTAPARGRGR